MKPIFHLIICLFPGFLIAEESSFMEQVRRAMIHNGWETGDVTFQEVEATRSLIIKRSGKLVGYYFDESIWERRKLDVSGLKGVTKIVMGYDNPGVGNPNSYVYFEIDSSDEIALWIAAYQNQTELESRFSCFVPTSNLAGFERKREEYAFGGACGCTLGLRFYSGEKEVLELKGHLQQGANFNSGRRNRLLHTLVKSKIPEMKKDYDVEKSDPFVVEPEDKDPFAEEGEGK